MADPSTSNSTPLQLALEQQDPTRRQQHLEAILASPAGPHPLSFVREHHVNAQG